MNKLFKHKALGEQTLKAPFIKEICPTCQGIGRAERTDIDMSILVDSMYEECNEEGLESYFNGAYDVICPTCKGNNVIDSFDMQYLYDNYPEEMKEVEEYEASERESREIREAERRMGA